MKYFMLLTALIMASCQQKDQTVESKLITIPRSEDIKNNTPEPQDLYALIGTNYQSKSTQEYISNFGKCQIENYFEGKIDYLFKNNGIQIRTNLEGKIEVIYLFNYKTKEWKPRSFKGQLPFDLNFSDTFDEIKTKIGEGSLFHRYGFYGRIFRWQIQDSLKLGIELDLPRKENEKIFIEQLTLTKIN